jgi:hypothetical protein
LFSFGFLGLLVARLIVMVGRAFYLSPYLVYVNMKDIDRKIRKILVSEGYLMPVTDIEIEQALAELEANPIEMPNHLDDPLIFLSPIRQKRNNAIDK